jgi:hypothetical protein
MSASLHNIPVKYNIINRWLCRCELDPRRRSHRLVCTPVGTEEKPVDSEAPGWLLGVGYKPMNYLHHVCGRTLVRLANLHAFGCVFKWVLAGMSVKELATRFIS